MSKWRIVLEGDMPFPMGRIEQITSVEEVPIVVVTVPPGMGTARVDDDRPFDWPADPGPLNRGPEMRSAWTYVDPAGGHSYYVQLAEFGNPLPGSHRFAGMTEFRVRSPIPADCRLWASAGSSPRIIRSILAGVVPES